MKIKTKVFKFDLTKFDGKKVICSMVDYEPIYNDDNTNIVNYRLSFKINDINTNFVNISLFNLDNENNATSFNKRAALLLVSLNALNIEKDGSCEFDTKDLKELTGQKINCTLDVMEIEDNKVIWLIPAKLNAYQNAILNELEQAQQYYSIHKRYDALDRSISLDTARENEYNKEHETGNDY